MTDTAALEALKNIPAAADYTDFWKIAKAAKAAGIDYSQFDTWSRNGQGYNERQNSQIWNAIKTDGKITAGTLFYLAKQAGWQMPEAYRAEAQQGIDISGIVSQGQKQASGSADNEAVTQAQAAAHIAEAGKYRAEALAYLQGRGITPETAERFNIGYNRQRKAIVIPYADGFYYVERNTQTAPNSSKAAGWRYNNPKGLAKPVFNSPALRGGAEIVFITEGQIDAITIEQAGQAAIAVKEPSIITEEIKKGGAVTAKAFYIIPDDDAAGAKQSAALYEALTGAGFMAFLYCLPAGYHDVNDILVKGGADKLAGWLEAAAADYRAEAAQKLAEYQQITPAGSIDGFMAAITDGQPVVSTGFTSLDRALGGAGAGGFTDGFIIIGAQSSLGKTTFCLQMADQIAARGGRDILYIALEQGKIELMAKSISRQLYQKYIKVEATEYNGQPKVMAMADYRQGQGHYTALEISAAEIRTNYRYIPSDGKQAIARALREYASGAGKNIYYREARGADVNASHIRQAVAEHKEKTGRAPIVIIDYLQLLASDIVPDARGVLVPKARDEREILNNSIKSLTAISRDFSTTVIGISAFNRASYHTDAGMEAFNGSSRIEYSADVLIALQPDLSAVADDEDVWDGRTEKKLGVFNIDRWKNKYSAENKGIGGEMAMLLKLLKNRNGRAGALVSFKYKPKCDTFTDTGEEGKELAETLLANTNAGQQ